MDTDTGIINQFLALAPGFPTPLQREMNMVVHKMTYPMAVILARVPGDSLTERAKRLKVSRQTMYVWMSEKFRPTLRQAKRISKFTDVPVEHIVDNGFEVNNVPRRKARRKVARVATHRKKSERSTQLVRPRRRRATSNKHRVGED